MRSEKEVREVYEELRRQIAGAGAELIKIHLEQRERLLASTRRPETGSISVPAQSLTDRDYNLESIRKGILQLVQELNGRMEALGWVLEELAEDDGVEAKWKARKEGK